MGACLVISSPSRGVHWHVSFWGPRGEQEQAPCDGPCDWQGCSRSLVLTHHVQTAWSSPPPSPWFWGAGGS